MVYYFQTPCLSPHCIHRSRPEVAVAQTAASGGNEPDTSGGQEAVQAEGREGVEVVPEAAQAHDEAEESRPCTPPPADNNSGGNSNSNSNNSPGVCSSSPERVPTPKASAEIVPHVPETPTRFVRPRPVTRRRRYAKLVNAIRKSTTNTSRPLLPRASPGTRKGIANLLRKGRPSSPKRGSPRRNRTTRSQSSDEDGQDELDNMAILDLLADMEKRARVIDRRQRREQCKQASKHEGAGQGGQVAPKRSCGAADQPRRQTRSSTRAAAK